MRGFGVQAHESSILRFVGLCMFASFCLAFWGLGDLEFRSLRSRVSGFRDQGFRIQFLGIRS